MFSFSSCSGSLWTLLQNATDMITKHDRFFIRKCDKSLLQNVSAFLLQHATALLQNVTVVTKCNGCFTKCDSYYKILQYQDNEIWSVN